ncbi:MAG TPA: hypothetical protein VG841_00825 [Caulobacterales bacterium]|nr:hypothetical protein [Caulobacterales bacterium]
MRRGKRASGARRFMGVALIGVVFAVLGAFALSAVLLKAPPIDPETLCRTDRPLAAHTFILVDSTDKLELRHRRKLRAVATQERARLQQYDRLTLARLNPRRPQEPTILFSKCLPRAPEDANPLFENPRLARERWDADFASALDTALRSAQHGGAGDASPILAGLRAAAADPDFSAEVAARRFVLVSDMLEHDPRGFSLYADGVAYAQWRAAPAHRPADFDNVDVRVAPLDRPEHAARQAEALASFWPGYFDEAGAKSVDVDPY